MVYGQYSRSRTTRRRSAYPKRAGASAYKKVIKPTRQALPALQKQIATLKKAITPLAKNALYYRNNFDSVIGNLSGGSVFVRALMNPLTWVRMFGTDGDDEQSHAFTLKKHTIYLTLETNNERDAHDYSMFICRLKNNGEGELWNQSLGTLNALAQDVHYATGTVFGQGAILNPEYFDVCYTRRFMTGTSSSSATDLNDLRKRFVYNWPASRMFTIKNPSGDWRASPAIKSIQQNYFLIVINNDSTADEDTTLKGVQYITGTAV